MNVRFIFSYGREVCVDGKRLHPANVGHKFRGYLIVDTGTQ